MRFGLVALLLLLATAAVWSPTLRYSYVYEDRRFITDAIDGRVAWRVPKRWAASVSWALDGLLFGRQPIAQHAGNLLWHLIAVFGVLWLVWRPERPWVAIAAAGVFALHPIQGEAVAYVSSRPDLVATAGVLLALGAASAGSLTGALVGVVLASLAKETALVAWGLVLLWTAWTCAAFPIRAWLALMAAGLLGSVAVLVAHVQGLTPIFSLSYIGEQCAALWRLLLLIPIPDGFSIDHDWSALASLGPVALVLSAGLTAWAFTDGWWGRHWIAGAWLWTLIVLAPRFVFRLDEGLHEHHMGLILLGVCLCAGHHYATHAQRHTIQHG